MLYGTIEKNRRAIQENPQFKKSYQEWLNNPITQMVIGILTVEGQPTTPQAINGEIASLNLGNSIGWVNCLHRMQSLDLVQKQEEIESTFEKEEKS